jgi:hypothetical protein
MVRNETVRLDGHVDVEVPRRPQFCTICLAFKRGYFDAVKRGYFDAVLDSTWALMFRG